MDLDIGLASRGLVLKNAPDVPAQWSEALAQRGPLHAGQRTAEWVCDDIVERDLLRAAGDDADLQVILKSLPTPGESSTTSMPWLSRDRPARRRRVAAIAGNYKHPLDTRISLRARAMRKGAVLLLYSTARARRPRHQALCSAPVSTRRLAALLGRTQIGNSAAGAPARRVVLWKKPAPSWLAPLKSGLKGMPSRTAAFTESFRQRIVMPPIRHRQRTAAANDIHRRRAAGSPPF